MRSKPSEITHGRRGERGAALVMSLLVSMLLLAAGGALIATAGMTASNAADATAEVQAAFAADAGLQDVRVRGEELLANWFGWANRTLESTANHEEIPKLWFQYAFRGYLALQKVDVALLEGRLPPAIFYNLMLAAQSPAAR